MNESTAQGNATAGRVYGGDCGLIHIADGMRADMGARVAFYLAEEMRAQAVALKGASYADAYGIPGTSIGPLSLCPGCYMVALFNAAVMLARGNGQDLRELGATMRDAFAAVAELGDAADMESIEVRIDPA